MEKVDKKTVYKHICFINISYLYPKRKTTVWRCESRHGNDDGEGLGFVMWFNRWRQYCFYPNKETIFSKGCMNDINDFIEQLMHEAKRKVKP